MATRVRPRNPTSPGALFGRIDKIALVVKTRGLRMDIGFFAAGGFEQSNFATVRAAPRLFSKVHGAGSELREIGYS